MSAAWIRIVFGGLLVAVVVGGHVYLYRRLIHDATERRALRWLGASAIATLTLGAAGARWLLRDVEEGRPLLLGLLIWLGVALYLLLAFLFVDAVKWASQRHPGAKAVVQPRREFLATAARATAVTAASGVAGYGVFSAYSPAEVTEIPVRLAGLPKALEGMTLVQLTDVHVGPLIRERFLDDLINRANALKPDVVAITGDLVDGSPSDLGRAVARLKRLQSRYGTYFVTGNHDYYSDDRVWVPELERMGMTVLRNRRVEIGDRGGGASFDLIGVDDWSARFSPRQGYNLQTAIAGRDRNRASVLLAHQPSNFDVVANEGLGLQLSGHTHGGQMFPATVFGRMIWGTSNNGLSSLQGSQLYVSRGCGFVGPPMRVASAPEIVKIVLLPA